MQGEKEEERWREIDRERKREKDRVIDKRYRKTERDTY